MLIGSILKENPALAVTTRLIDVNSGKIISSQQVTNFPSDKFFSLGDSLTYLLKDQFRDATAAPADIKPVAEVTTKSTEAYRAYVEGLNLSYKLYFKEAEGAFKRAVELDSNFAMAYFYLALMQRFNGQRYLAFKTFRKAAELADNATERDRLLIFAMNYGLMGKTKNEESVLKQLIKQYPHEIFPYAYLNYLCLNYLLDPEKSIEYCSVGWKYNSSVKILLNFLAYSFAYLNRKAEAFNAINKYVRLAPAEPNPYDTKGDLYVWFADYDSSRMAFKEAISLRSDFSSASKLGYYAVIHQKYGEASDYFQMSGYKIPVIEIHKGQINNALGRLQDNQHYLIKIHLYYELGKYPEMLSISNEYSKALRFIRMKKFTVVIILSGH